MEVYHQLGHNGKWNLDSYTEDGTGDGIILAPRYMPIGTVQHLDAHVRKAAIFDPQFFLPGTARGELSTYDFFPCVAAGEFETCEYVDSFANTCAQQCVDFQIKNEFRYIVIPTRHKSG